MENAKESIAILSAKIRGHLHYMLNTFEIVQRLLYFFQSQDDNALSMNGSLDYSSLIVDLSKLSLLSDSTANYFQEAEDIAKRIKVSHLAYLPEPGRISGVLHNEIRSQKQSL